MTVEDELDARLGDDSFPRNPYPVLAALREQSPVHWSDAWGFWVVARYDDVTAILRDPRRFSNVGRSAPVERLPEEQRHRMAPMLESFRVGMPSSDPPTHTRIRTVVNKAVTPSRVAAMRPRVQAIFDELLASILADEAVDLIPGIAYPFPAIVVAELVGLPVADRDQFKQWSADIIALHSRGVPDPDAAERAWDAWRAARAWLEQLIAERRARPREDVLSTLVTDDFGGEGLSDLEIVSTLVTLMTAGHETTTGLIGNGMLALLRAPDQLRRLHDDPTLIGTAVDEVLRYESPFPRAWRKTAVDVELSGVGIPAGQIVSASLAAANRDPGHFPDPDTFDIGRTSNRHLGLGAGIHFCLGAPLARLEGEIALGTLARSMPEVKLETEPVWQSSITHHVLEELRLRWTGSAAARA